LGRWISQDPIGLRGDLNLYGYSNESPVVWADSTGLQVDLNLHREGQVEQGRNGGYFDPHKAAQGVPKDPGIYKIAGHSNVPTHSKVPARTVWDNREGPGDGKPTRPLSPEDLARETRTDWDRKKIKPKNVKEIQLFLCNTDLGPDPFAQQYADEICRPVRPCITWPLFNDTALYPRDRVKCELAPEPFMPRPGKCGA
jgi:uncharacterized protein RhaS with RHS repeats